jgi:hypothetical protein
VGRRARALVMVVILMVVLAGAGRARAEVVHHPQGAFAVFSDCPLNNPLVFKCVVVNTTGGELLLGDMTVPITKTFEALRGGYGEAVHRVSSFFAPEGGVPIQPMPLPVPGGLAGVLEPSLLPSSLRATFEDRVEGGLGGLTATMELAGLASGAIRFSEYNATDEEGVALEEPVKLKLTNPFLGEDCYIGSASDPIVVQATTGQTNPPPSGKSLKGQTGTAELIANAGIARLVRNVDVASSFAVPAASGCGGSLAPLVDRAIDARVGLPSPAGRNAAILDNTAEIATPTSVIENE